MLFRRYAPFIALAAVQLLVVLVAPSHPSTTGTAALGGTFDSGAAAPSSAATGVPGAPGPVPTGTTGPGTVSTTPGQAAPGTVGSTGSGATGGAATGAGATGATGTTGGKATAGQFCFTGLNEHSPCVPKWTGGDNGGATSMGVTAKKITVVMYRNASNAAVDGILRSTGTYISPAAEQDMYNVVGSYINKRLQLYDRQIDWKYVVGTCDPAPPQDACFRADADSIVAQYKPFAVFWDNNTNEAAFQDELSRKGVVNWGGWHFQDAFNNALRPYHYDVFMGGTQQAEIAGEWYCKRLANKKARFAGAALQGQQRKTAVIYADTPQTTPSAKRLQAIIKGCDRNGVYDAPYSSDTTTASSQSTTQASAMKSAGVTTVVWFCDVIAPAYGTKAQTAQNYYPEEVLAGSGLLDYDALAQTYDPAAWAHAFGPSDLAQNVAVKETDAGIIWRAEGRSGDPDANANLLTSYALSVATGIVAAGPKLTPLAYEYGLLTTPGYDSWDQWKNPRLLYVKYGKDDYTAISDIREVYYDPQKVSPTNGRPGSYVPLNGGRRYRPGTVPTGEPSLPPGV